MTQRYVLKAGFVACAMIFTLARPAVGADTPFGGLKHDSSQPIEIVSDSLEVRQAEQIATFTGAVEARQGTLVLTADRLEVLFDQNADDAAEDEAGAIRKVIASGSVFLTSGDETAQGQRAEYDVLAGTIRMTGDVVLNQGANAITGEALDIDLNRGFGRMESSGQGRVRSVFTPGSAQ